jgi:hypothetical protein
MIILVQGTCSSSLHKFSAIFSCMKSSTPWPFLFHDNCNFEMRAAHAPFHTTAPTVRTRRLSKNHRDGRFCAWNPHVRPRWSRSGASMSLTRRRMRMHVHGTKGRWMRPLSVHTRWRESPQLYSTGFSPSKPLIFRPLMRICHEPPRHSGCLDDFPAKEKVVSCPRPLQRCQVVTSLGFRALS